MKKEMKTITMYTRPVCKTVSVNLSSQVLQGSSFDPNSGTEIIEIEDPEDL